MPSERSSTRDLKLFGNCIPPIRTWKIEHKRLQNLGEIYKFKT